jgi:short-subunit dehydrogenase
VNVASAASKVTPAGESTYTGTKHAVYGYTHAVRAELRSTPVKLTLVMPVVVATDLAAGTSPGREGTVLTPAEVGRAVAGVIRKPRDELFVPRRAGFVLKLITVAPPRLRDLLTRALVPDQLNETDHSARAAYQEQSFKR